MWKEKPTVRQISELVEKVRKIKNPLFRKFIYVNLGPRARALPVADTARAQSVPWSADDEAVCGKETAGHHKRTAVKACKKLPFACKNAQKPQKNAKFFCPLLDISVSGSPIIQGGKLVGAVTHVPVNDPATGYGIFIENMPEAAG